MSEKAEKNRKSRMDRRKAEKSSKSRIFLLKAEEVATLNIFNIMCFCWLMKYMAWTVDIRNTFT
jgi:hypothetical protein